MCARQVAAQTATALESLSAQLAAVQRRTSAQEEYYARQHSAARLFRRSVWHLPPPDARRRARAPGSVRSRRRVISGSRAEQCWQCRQWRQAGDLLVAATTAGADTVSCDSWRAECYEAEELWPEAVRHSRHTAGL